MAKHYYKRDKKKTKRLLRIASASIVVLGIGILFYVLFPLISWQIYFAPAFASQKFEIPIPKTTVVNNSTIGNLLTTAAVNIGVDYTNASNWYPSSPTDSTGNDAEYYLSIPSINLENAFVSSKDNDLTTHLVQYNKDTRPPQKGTSLIFGHSTLPQLFDPKNYKTIFANAYKVKVGDDIKIKIKNVTYTYKVQNVIVVEANDTSVLAQDLSDSFITIITCTPPGTIWKRLVIKAKLQNI